MKSITLLNKNYSDESLYDLERDIDESFYDEFNPELLDIPKDKHGFRTGTFSVSIVWHPDNKEST